MVKELKLDPPVVKLIVNRAPGGAINDGIKEAIAQHGLDLLAVLPQDNDVYEYDTEGKPTAEVPEDNPVKAALYKALDTLEL
jgi:CO dehydrogenase maturation factor